MLASNEEKVAKWRNLFMVILSLQMALLLERLVFDCLGGIWLLVIFDSCTILVNTVTIFGAGRNRLCIFGVFVVWSLVWVLFNVMTVCVYLKVGSLDHEDKMLSFRINNKSWFETNGFGCNATQVNNNEKCDIRFEHIEASQAVIHIAVSICNLVICIWFLRKLRDDTAEDQFRFIGGQSMNRGNSEEGTALKKKPTNNNAKEEESGLL